MKPVYLTQKEAAALGDETANAIIAHNELGEQLCGWKPPRKKRQ